MGIIMLFRVLFQIQLLSIRGLYRLLAAMFNYGINVMALLKIAERTYGDKIALIDDHETLTYRELSLQSERLSDILRHKYELASDKKVGLLCRNHASLVKSIFAASQTGADIYLLNAEMSASQIDQLLEDYRFDLLIYDADLIDFVEESSYANHKLLSCHEDLPAINHLLHTDTSYTWNRKRASSSQLQLLTGGTTGRAKRVAHKPSLFHYLNPFSALLTRLHLLQRHTAYIATPIYHGYGIAILLLFIALGKKVVITTRFEAEKACSLIRNHKVDVVSVVPLMIDKMLKQDADSLKSLKCIASGGAELNPKLAAMVTNELGDVLYNLYGTSEAGLCVVATPKDLKDRATTIGQPIKGVRLHVLDSSRKKAGPGVIGSLSLQKKWSFRTASLSWMDTGDLGFRDERGYYFLCGRADRMIVSAGENVYPIELEQILIVHPLVEDTAVIGVSDESFGQRLKAYVQPVANVELTEAELIAWLRPRAARYQMPKEIVIIDQIPYTDLGKQDKKRLGR